MLLFASSRRKLEVYKNKSPELPWEGNFKQVQEGLICFLTELIKPIVEVPESPLLLDTLQDGTEVFVIEIVAVEDQ